MLNTRSTWSREPPASAPPSPKASVFAEASPDKSDGHGKATADREITIACRMQDDLGGEGMKVIKLKVN